MQDVADSDDEELGPEDKYDEDLDIDTNPALEADATDASALLATLVVEFEAGDTLGKALAFVNQLRACSATVLDLFKKFCVMHEIDFRSPKLWVRTRWGSLADCLKWLLMMRKVCDFLTVF